MLIELLDQGSIYPKLRRPIIQLYRRARRIRRATLAKAVLVIHNESRRVVMSPASGKLSLPFIDLHAWEPITTQVEAYAREILNQRCDASLVAVEGTPGPKGVIFLYRASVDVELPLEGQVWVDPGEADGFLPKTGSRHLLLCNTSQREASAKA